MTKVIIKSDNEREIEISTHLPPDKIEKLIRELEEEELVKRALDRLFGILETDKSIEELREEIYEEIS
ncbi:hypothetical protein [Persephonella sp. IF05-L8]|uniref:hypothetical protein n=1 Tax=Persephonella sp. IF05-L8 TaxID=1158338 RepID=UPI0004950A7C